MNDFIPNSVINAMARQTMKGRWFKNAVILLGIFILEVVIEILITILFHAAGRGIYAIFETFIASFIILWWFNMVKYDDDRFDHSAEALRKFGNFAGAGILYGLIVFIGYILFIIPGIIFQFSYSQVFFITADTPAMPVIDAFKLSRKMMYGCKWKLFCLNCRFIGWWILAIFTFGIGFLFIIPYQAAANIHFYRNVKATYEAQNGEIRSTEYEKMSALNTIMLTILIFIWNSGIFYLISLLKNMAK